MPIKVICSGCGHQLVVRDELLGKRVRCPQCKAGFIADAEVEPAATGGHGLIEKLIDQWPAVVGMGLIAVGIWVVIATHGLPGSRMITRAGLGLIGLGIASFGYWALSSSNKDYNF